ncbi:MULTISPECIES: YhgE/Pip domain-containing protein [unclassified Brevibacterium]|uniref:YhgE/Pip domain-containing protein n=1 Tax=unclassified Brevibacterium TaxID=2614124 RepID=UPI001E59FF0A|nr:MULTISPECIES: YhgE/Pip domain-containing protein [unclassified Brevibacterium]MCD1286590.1 YhgE/Pip domain-containing protein [Brevibacterium sp. CCUG 69071]MDK8434179.1 YhgE/Pip domain-containing protein [Brevibacterium sp. H-BE7]
MFSLPWLELTRFRRHTITRLAIIVVAIIPAIYGGLYLASNWAPTDHLDQLKAAVVNEDTGANKPNSDDESLHAGDELVDKITPKGEGGFDWQETSQQEADEGLASGEYFAILEIPSNFSERLVSTGGDDPEQAGLQLRTDDAHNFIVGQLANTVLTEIRSGLNETTTSEYVSEVYVGFNDIHSSTEDAVDGATQLNDGAVDLHKGTGDLVDGTTELDKGVGTLQTGIGDLDDGAGQLVAGSGDLKTGADTLAKSTTEAKNGSKKLADGAGQVADGTGELRGVADDATDKADDLKKKADDLVDGTRPKLQQAEDDFDSARTSVNGDVDERIKKLEEKYPDDPDVAKLADDMDSLGGDLDDAHSRAKDATDKAKDLENPVRDAVDDVMDKIHDADKKIGKLDDGAQQVSTGADDLHSGLIKLDDGAGKLAEGAGDLNDGAIKLKDGTAKAKSGVADLKDGSSQLVDGSTKLDTGAGKLVDGSGELKDGLEEGLKQIPTYDKSDRENRSDVVAVPVDAEKLKDNAVSAYGEGLAAFFVSLALWIGGMITYMVINAIPYRALASSAKSTRIAWAGYVPGLLFAVAQVAVLYGVLTFALDFSAGAWVGTLLFSILVAGSFHAVHQLCVAALGGVGRLIALVLLMVQIASAGGTYPVQTAPGIFQVISPFLPMTHAVNGLRTLIAGGDMFIAAQSAVVLLLMTLICLAATTIVCSRKRMVSLTQLHPSLTL